MTFDDDTIVLDEDDVAACVVKEMTRRGLAEPGRPYYVRFTLSPEGTFVVVPGGAPLAIVVTLEPRDHA